MTLDDLVPGDYVAVRGFLDGSSAIAAELDRNDADPRARLRGPVTAEDEAASTVDILGVTVAGLPPTTQYRDQDEAPITQSQFHAAVQPGTFVDARWDAFVSTADPADELSLEDD